MPTQAATVEQYLAQLPEDRRQALEAVRQVILKNLPKGYEEGIQYGMIGYFVPHRVYPAGYHCDPKQPLPFASLASQKNHMAIYMMCIYADPEHERWFREAWAGTGKKLDMGKSCIRFKKIDDLPLEVIGQAIKRVPAKKFIEFDESSVNKSGRKRAAQSGAKRSASGAATSASKGTGKRAPSPKAVARPTRKKPAGG